MNIQGTWSGTVVYGKGYGKLIGKELYFELEIEQDGDRISGKGRDTGGVGVSPDEATIVGNFVEQDLSILFVKQYSTFHYFEDESIKVDKSNPSYPITYTGQYNPEKAIFEGTWVIEGIARILWIIPWPWWCRGNWTLKRK